MISVFTPTNNTKYLAQAYQSLLEQTHQDWEWILLLNGGAEDPGFSDPRVKVFQTDFTGMVGTLKRMACEKAKGDILLEFDHDDLLTPDCLEEVQKAFDSDPEVIFAYSNFANVSPEYQDLIWSEAYGWRYRDFEYKGHQIKECISAEPDPQSISRIWFAPNHVRAWKAKAYWQIGGHADMKISDDHDLMLRTFLIGKMKHIDKCLYIYFVHGENTWLKYQNEIQTTMWACHDKYIEPMMMKWSKENNLRMIDLCGGIDKPDGYESIDLYQGDITADLNENWPLKDNSVGLLRASDALEHLKDPIHTMNEAYRVLAHGGVFLIAVPSTDGRGAFCDPTHISYWNSRSFRYYTEASVRRYLEPKCQCRFQVIKVTDGLMHDNLPYVFAHLIAIKDDSKRFYGDLKI